LKERARTSLFRALLKSNRQEQALSTDFSKKPGNLSMKMREENKIHENSGRNKTLQFFYKFKKNQFKSFSHKAAKNLWKGMFYYKL
jgi:hypothetical protein